MCKNPVTKLSRSETKEELQSAHRQLWEQIVLPNVSTNEDLEYEFDAKSLAFAQRIKHALTASREMQRNLENRVRKRMTKVGDEKRFVVSTPVAEVVKGFPEVELKWMFGSNEVVVPKAIGLHLFHGWKKWRVEVKANLKRDLLENVELGKKYVAEKMVRFLKLHKQ